MTDVSEDTQPAMAYPTKDQYARWKGRADELDMSVSGFMQSMIEAGMKKFEATVEPDETNRELREQRNDLKDELDHARERIEALEERLYHSDSAEVRRFVEENPGTSFDLITDYMEQTVPVRVNKHLTMMEGESLEVHNGRYYLRQDADVGTDVDADADVEV